MPLQEEVRKTQLERYSQKIRLGYSPILLLFWRENLVRIFNPQAQQSNLNKRIPAMYTSHQNGKKTKYGPGIRKVEKATLTAAVMSTPSFFISNNNFGEGFKLLNFGHF